MRPSGNANALGTDRGCVHERDAHVRRAGLVAHQVGERLLQGLTARSGNAGLVEMHALQQRHHLVAEVALHRGGHALGRFLRDPRHAEMDEGKRRQHRHDGSGGDGDPTAFEPIGKGLDATRGTRGQPRFQQRRVGALDLSVPGTSQDAGRVAQARTGGDVPERPLRGDIALPFDQQAVAVHPQPHRNGAAGVAVVPDAVEDVQMPRSTPTSIASTNSWPTALCCSLASATNDSMPPCATTAKCSAR